MASILVVYGSGEGQTQKVANHIEGVLSGSGHDVTVRRVDDVGDVVVDEFDAVLVGSPVNNRKHRPDVLAFVEANREALAARPNGFFQLSLASIVPLKWAQSGAQEFVNDLVSKTGWQPDHVGLFAGAVKYTQYEPVERVMFKLVSAVTTGDTDTSRDYEYTDWNDVEAFATEFGAYVETQLVVTRGETTTQSRPKRVGQTVASIAFVLVLAGAVYWAAARKFAPAEC